MAKAVKDAAETEGGFGTGLRGKLERRRDVGVGESAGSLHVAALEHRTEQLRLHRGPIDLHVLCMRRLE